MLLPKITYPASAPTTTLVFTYPPVEKPGIDDRDALRFDSLTVAGIRQSQWARTDIFKRLRMKFVPMADLPNWAAFINYGFAGGSFLYYPDATDLTTFDEYLLEDSGGSVRAPQLSESADAWNPTFNCRTISEFDLVFRRKSSIVPPYVPQITWRGPPSGTPAPNPGPTPGGSSGSGSVDLLATDWILMKLPDRLSFHMTGTGHTYSIIDTDALWPAGYPTSGWFAWVKNSAGHPWDIERYDGTYAVIHQITENGNVPGGFNNQFGYKRSLNGVPVIPRNYVLGGSPVTIDTPGPNHSHLTTNCETAFTLGALGDVRCITSGPFTMAWGGDIGTQPTIQNDYLYGGKISTGIFKYKESTFFVQGFGRICWKFFINGAFITQTLKNMKVAGVVAPSFPCGAGKPWWV